MRIAAIRIKDYKVFADSGELELGSVTLLVGPNNVGKSAVIRATTLLQQFQYQQPIASDVRIGSDTAEILFQLEDVRNVAGWDGIDADRAKLKVSIVPSGTSVHSELHVPGTTNPVSVVQLPMSAPGHLVVPFLGRRKVIRFNEDLGRQAALQVGPDLQNLAAKLSRITIPDFDQYELYASVCRELIGHVIHGVAAEHQGMRPGVYVDAGQTHPIYLESMGEGVAHIVGFLADLVLSENKVFLIEELESDLHPRALHRLLDLIVEASDRNQFIVSTHSNIVLRHLGGKSDARVYELRREEPVNRVPTSSIRAVGTNAQARMDILRELGYTLSDFDLWEAWLFVEEASAESIISSFLIPWFVPELRGRVRTVSTAGADRAEPVFDDFRRLLLYTHLEPHYRSRAWVLIDGDEAGTAVVQRLRKAYSNWPADRFATLSEPTFENYYPDRFDASRSEALALTGRAKQRAKEALVKNVREWCVAENDESQKEFAQSASEVIARLREIAESLDNLGA